MNRLKLGLVVPIALLVTAGCHNDPTASLANGIEKIEAAPSQIFVEVGATKTVEVGAVDAQGNPLQFDYVVTETGPGITVKRDSTFLPVYINDTLLTAPPIASRYRFIVAGTAYANSSFTVSAGGKTIVVPVQVVPQNQIQATFEQPAPALGEVITLTAAAGTVFAQDAGLLIGGDPTRPLTITDRAADGTTISFIAPPNVASGIAITKVTSVGAPSLVFSPTTATVLTTPVIDTVDVTYSTATPAIGQVVTTSIPNTLIKFDATTDLVFPGTFTGPAAGPQNITVAPDSSSLTFDAPPNANGLATVTSFVFPGGYPIALPTRTGIVTRRSLPDTANVTVSNANPALLAPITITLPASLKFGAAAGDSVFIGNGAAIIQSVGGGGASIDVIPLPGSVGQPRLVGVFPTGFAQFSLAMPTDELVTVPGLTPLVGTDDPATAPLIAGSRQLYRRRDLRRRELRPELRLPLPGLQDHVCSEYHAALHSVVARPGRPRSLFPQRGRFSDAAQVVRCQGSGSLHQRIAI